MKTIENAKKVLVVFFFFYLLILSWFSFIGVDSTNRHTYFTQREIHLIPFQNTYLSFKSLDRIASIVPKDQFPYYQYLFIRNIIGNVVLFIPLGFIAPSLFQKINSRKLIAAAFCLSAFIESMQYVLIIGVFDIDDIIFNVLGFLIGLNVFAFLKKKYLNYYHKV